MNVHTSFDGLRGVVLVYDRYMNPVRLVMHSPVGPLRIDAADDGVTSCAFIDTHQAGAEEPDTTLLTRDKGSATPLGHALRFRNELCAYFKGELCDFLTPLAPAGTEFQRRVWLALLTIPYAATITYGKLAASVGCEGGARAVGLANARNPIAIVIPCHRVIAADGSLHGYAGGLDRKRTLLDLELEHAGALTGLFPHR